MSRIFTPMSTSVTQTSRLTNDVCPNVEGTQPSSWICLCNLFSNSQKRSQTVPPPSILYLPWCSVLDLCSEFTHWVWPCRGCFRLAPSDTWEVSIHNRSFAGLPSSHRSARIRKRSRQLRRGWHPFEEPRTKITFVVGTHLSHTVARVSQRNIRTQAFQVAPASNQVLTSSTTLQSTRLAPANAKSAREIIGVRCKSLRARPFLRHSGQLISCCEAEDGGATLNRRRTVSAEHQWTWICVLPHKFAKLVSVQESQTLFSISTTDPGSCRWKQLPRGLLWPNRRKISRKTDISFRLSAKVLFPVKVLGWGESGRPDSKSLGLCPSEHNHKTCLIRKTNWGEFSDGLIRKAATNDPGSRIHPRAASGGANMVCLAKHPGWTHPVMNRRKMADCDAAGGTENWSFH